MPGNQFSQRCLNNTHNMVVFLCSVTQMTVTEMEDDMETGSIQACVVLATVVVPVLVAARIICAYGPTIPEL